MNPRLEMLMKLTDACGGNVAAWQQDQKREKMEQKTKECQHCGWEDNDHHCAQCNWPMSAIGCAKQNGLCRDCWDNDQWAAKH